MIPAAESSCFVPFVPRLKRAENDCIARIVAGEAWNPPTAKTPFIPGTVLHDLFDFCNNVARVIKGNPVRTLHDNHEIADVLHRAKTPVPIFV